MTSPGFIERFDLRRRAKAALWHLMLSLGVAALSALLVFGLWFPGAFRSMSGGRSLFMLVVSVDVVLGPLLTFMVFDLRKGWPHLKRDLAVIGLVQLAGLAYGLHTVYTVRPVAAVFEVDRLRVVTAGEVFVPELDQAAAEFRRLPLTGPWLLGTREAKDGDERLKSVTMALEGVDKGQRPSFWQSYEASRADAVKRARPIAALLAKYPARGDEIRAMLKDTGLDADTGRFLPVMARGDWIALLDAQGDVKGYLPFDGFF